MNFGVPSQRVKREEEFPNNAILTIGIDGGKGTSRQMSFNKLASDVLRLDDKSQVAFSFNPDTCEAYLVNTDIVKAAASNGIRVTKGTPRKISHKKTYNYFTKLQSIDTSVENHFELILSDEHDGVFNILPFVNADISSAMKALDEDIVDDTVNAAHAFNSQIQDIPEMSGAFAKAYPATDSNTH